MDGGARSCARQVNDVAADLAAWLACNGQQVSTWTVTMIMHEQAMLGRCEDVSVNVVGTQPAPLLGAIEWYATPLAPQPCGRIVALIRCDH